MRAVDRQDDTGDLEPSGVPPIAGLVLRTRLLELLDGAPPRTPLWITAIEAVSPLRTQRLSARSLLARHH
jgi:hypothetical protein